jgi:hypothetical protein
MRGESIEISGVEIHYSFCAGRRWLKRDHVVLRRIAEQFLTPIPDADIEVPVCCCRVVFREERACIDNGRQQFYARALRQAGVAKGCSGGDSSTEADDKRGLRIAAMDYERQKCLQAHVAHGGQSVA